MKKLLVVLLAAVLCLSGILVHAEAAFRAPEESRVRNGFITEKGSEEDEEDEDDPEEVQDRLNACKEQFHKLQQRYEIRPSELRGRGGEEEPINNVLSGCDVFLPYGDGLLDFIYADFKTPFEKNVFKGNTCKTTQFFSSK